MSNCTETGCGFKSECVVDECVCDGGYFVTQDFILDETSTDCHGNIVILVVFYAVELICTIYSVISYLMRVKRRSQAKRLIPYFIVMGGFGFTSIIKLSDIEGRVFGEDIAVTLISAAVFPATMLASHVLLIKYVMLMYRMLHLQPETAKTKLKRLQSILTVNTFMSFIAAAVYISTLVLADPEEIQILFRCAFGLMVLTTFSYCYAHYKFAQEIKKLLLIPTESDVKLITVKRRVEGVRSGSMTGYIILMVLYAIPATSFVGLQFYGYVVPIQGAIGCLVTVAVLHGNRAGHKTPETPAPTEIGFIQNNSTSSGNPSAVYGVSSDRLGTPVPI